MGRMGWYMLDNNLQLCSEAPATTKGRECAAWMATNETFWASMVTAANRQRAFLSIAGFMIWFL